MKYSSDNILLGETSSNTTDSTVPKRNGKQDCDTKWLLDWIKKMERELQPLDFRVKWTPQNLELEMNRHKALQAEIDEKASEVHSSLKGLFESQGRGAEANVRTAERLQKRWLQLILRVVEYIEFLKGRSRHIRHDKRSGLCTPKWGESDEDNNEPVTKHPRLTSSPPPIRDPCDILDNNSQQVLLTEEDTGITETYSSSSPIVSLAADTNSTENNTGCLLIQESFSNSIHAVVDDGDYEMGHESHENESVFNKSGSPVPNSIAEYTFVDASQSVGMKRKLSSSSTTTTTTQQLQQHVVPKKNISTYYFKHSDTESNELKLNQFQQQAESENIIKNLDGTDLMGIGIDQNLYKSLDFGQEYQQPTSNNTIPSVVNEENFASLELDVDMEGDEELNSLENLDEIEALVHNAELLVKVHSKGVVDSVSVVDELLLSDEEEREEEQNAELLLASAPGAERIATTTFIHQIQLRKSSIGSGGGKKPKSTTKCIVTNANNSMEYNNSHNTIGNSSVDRESGIAKCTSVGSKITNSGILNSNSKRNNRTRTRSWVLAHNTQKNASSCDASAESTSETESSSSDSEHVLSSDDPTTASASTYLNPNNTVLLSGSQSVLSQSLSQSQLKGAVSSCSSSNHLGKQQQQRSPTSSLLTGGVIWRSKKRLSHGKQRPKSFTETSGALLQSSQQNNCFFVSDTALNFLGSQSSWSSSAGSSYLPGGPQAIGSQGTIVEREKKKNKRRKSSKIKRKSIEIDENDGVAPGFARSTSFTEGRLGEQVVPDSNYPVSEDLLEEQIYKPLQENFDGRVHPKLLRLFSDNGSVNTEDLHGLNDQDWDSYQEKYLSEPYSEEALDGSKLLAFGEDYTQFLDLDQDGSECSSVLSGFEPNPTRKRRPLMLVNRSEMDSDSDKEELNYLLNQSSTQLRFVSSVFRKQLLASSADLVPGSPAEYAEMEATCEENINSLQLILTKIEIPSDLPFDIDTRSIQGVLEKWHILREKIKHAAKLHQIQEEMLVLKKDFHCVQSHLGLVKPFDSNDLLSLQNKIQNIQGMLSNLNERKHKLQSLNEASLGTQLFLRESNAVVDIKKQIQELYALYEENFQLGSYLLGKMRFLHEAWEKFECEKMEFEKSINLSNLRPKVKKELSASSASSDSGHGTDFSHDSSISDSDMDFQERREKLVALRKRASDLKAFLPPGSPVMSAIDQQIDEAAKGFEELRRKKCSEPLDLKIIHPKKRTLFSSRKNVSRKPSRSKSSTLDFNQETNSKGTSKKSSSKKWRIIRLTLTFHLMMVGVLAVAYFLQPKCCEFSNNFRCSLVPTLSHDSLPTI